MDNHECGGYYFTSNFDSGNLMTVHLVKSNDPSKDKTSAKPNEPHCDVEFNLWTRPDCAGTVYENSNRTWFYFGIRGGEPNKTIKLNIMNLNKQAKLFSQGMHPVIKIGDNGNWERIKDKPVYSLSNESFFMSFLHKTNDIPNDINVFYAFTFPFTYAELQKQLDNFDKKFFKSSEEVKNIVNTLCGGYNEDDVGETSTATVEMCNNFDSAINNYDDEIRVSMSKAMEQIPSAEDETLLEPPSTPLVQVNEVPSLLEPDKVAAGPAVDENTSESMQQITKLVNSVSMASEMPLELLCTPNFAYAPSKIKEKTPQPESKVIPNVVAVDPFIELLCSPGFVYAKKSSSAQPVVKKIETSTALEESCTEILAASKTIIPSKKNQPLRSHRLDEMKKTKIKKPLDPLDTEIYYHRELLIRSYEGLRVDLLTITSFHGIQNDREENIEHLFPDHMEHPRCHKFKGKKIIFISSRVHPGETPASFVLNGFLNLLLDRKNVIAVTLRKMYVFKIVPFLNPDGVQRGNYRSDTLGHNLNRFYLCPDLKTQPSIYAARELVRFYHTGSTTQTSANETSDFLIEETKSKSETPENELPMNEYPPKVLEETIDVIEIKEQSTSEDKSNYNSASESSSVEDVSSKQNQISAEDTEDVAMMELVTTTTETGVGTDTGTASLTIFTDELIPTYDEIKPTVQDEPKTLAVKTGSGIKLNRKLSLKNTTNLFRSNTSHIPTSSSSKLKEFSVGSVSSTTTIKQRTNLRNKDGSAITVKNKNNQQYFSSRAHRNDVPSYQATKNVNISADFLQPDVLDGERQMVDDEKSNLFLYLDLHGHASKKGVFMYGNHLPNALESVECMLLPRLMSMNCHHFHFDACNFSERNMYFKGKRDGLSKEGSGRVAIYKATGLIKSYTLECNYNTGKCVNVLPPRGKETLPKIPNLIPPKYTPSIFEEVGRALGASILDVTNSNPLSRLVNSEFRTLQGLRNALKQEIDRNAIKAKTTCKIKIKTKRTLGAVTSKTEISKENKGGFHNNIQWDISSSSNTPCCSSATPSRPMSKSVVKTTSTIKITRKGNATKAFGYAKKENSSSTAIGAVGGSIPKSSKMAMVLCEASTSGVQSGASASGSKMVDIKRNKEQNQIPRKKVKVSPTQQQHSKPDDFLVAPHKYSVDVCYKSNLLGTSTSLPNFFVTTSHPVPPTHSSTDAKQSKSSDCKLFTSLDVAKPCCSYSTAPPDIDESSSSPAALSTPAQQPNKVVTIFQKEAKCKFSKATSSKQAKKFGTGENSRLKKKRTLKKTDGNVKRKSVKPLIH